MAAGAQTMQLTVIEQRESLIAWYERRGYRATGAVKPFPYDDARVGAPKRADLRLAVFEKALQGAAAARGDDQHHVISDHFAADSTISKL